MEQLLSDLDIPSLATRDQHEVACYSELMDLVFSSWQEIPFSESHIKQLHQILFRYSVKDAWHSGSYKTSSNSVAAFDTPRLMTELVDWLHQERKTDSLHPLLIIAIIVVVFLEIHPFQDGNGRPSRVFTSLLLFRRTTPTGPTAHWREWLSKARMLTTWRFARRKPQFAPKRRTGSHGLPSSCAPSPSRSGNWRRRWNAAP